MPIPNPPTQARGNDWIPWKGLKLNRSWRWAFPIWGVETIEFPERDWNDGQFPVVTPLPPFVETIEFPERDWNLEVIDYTIDLLAWKRLNSLKGIETSRGGASRRKGCCGGNDWIPWKGLEFVIRYVGRFNLGGNDSMGVLLDFWRSDFMDVKRVGRCLFCLWLLKACCLLG